jgi:phage/plasmid-associated DNA primase
MDFGQEEETPERQGVLEEVDENIVGRIKQLLREVVGDTTSVFFWKNSRDGSYYFRTVVERKCPGKHRHKSNNFYVIVRDGEIYYHCLSSECQKSYYLGRVKPLEFIEEEEPPLVEGMTSPVQALLTKEGFEGLEPGNAGGAAGRTTVIGVEKVSFSFTNETCPLCGKEHKHKIVDVIEITKGVHSVRVQTGECKATLLGLDKNKVLEELLECVDTDAPYAKVFNYAFGKDYRSYEDNFYHFNGVRWERVKSEVVYNEVYDYSERVVKKLMNHYNQAGFDLDILRADGGITTTNKKGEVVKGADACRVIYGRLKLGLKYLGKTVNMNQIRKALYNKVFYPTFEEDMDANPYLLGVKNGVIELTAPAGRVGQGNKGVIKFRKGGRGDNISMCAGCEFVEVKDEETKKEFLEFVLQILPNRGVRRLFQKFIGYCLLGVSNEKKIWMLTDKRGGFNGKSALVRLIQGMLGDYAKRPRPNILYKRDNADSGNSHGQGLIEHFKIRVDFYEEMDKTKVLDQEWLKEISGGETTISARVIHSKEKIEREWSAKTCMTFNENNAPRMDITDKAFMDRLVVIPFNSRFYPTDEEYEINKEIPNTFKADIDISRNFPAWRPYMLDWAMEGLQMYYEEGFQDIPQECQEFLQLLQEEQDTVKEFVEKWLEFETDDQRDARENEKKPIPFLTLSQLHSKFGQVCKHIQNDRKRRLNTWSFKTALMKHFNEASFKERHTWKENGKQREAKKSFLGVMWREQEVEDNNGFMFKPDNK